MIPQFGSVLGRHTKRLSYTYSTVTFVDNGKRQAQKEGLRMIGVHYIIVEPDADNFCTAHERAIVTKRFDCRASKMWDD